jgi:hypothetical protein
VNRRLTVDRRFSPVTSREFSAEARTPCDNLRVSSRALSDIDRWSSRRARSGRPHPLAGVIATSSEALHVRAAWRSARTEADCEVRTACSGKSDRSVSVLGRQAQLRVFEWHAKVSEKPRASSRTLVVRLGSQRVCRHIGRRLTRINNPTGAYWVRSAFVSERSATPGTAAAFSEIVAVILPALPLPSQDCVSKK